MGHKITPELENYAHEVKEKYGVPESITLAQAIYESSLGKSNLAQKNNNWFGIKSGSGWAKYDSARESFLAYGKLLSKDRYAKYTKNAKTDSEYINGVVKGGYCDDAGYTTNILSIISSNKLDQYNTGKFIGNSETNEKINDGVKTTDNTSLIGDFLSGIMKYIMIAVLVIIMILLMVFAFTPQKGVTV